MAAGGEHSSMNKELLLSLCHWEPVQPGGLRSELPSGHRWLQWAQLRNSARSTQTAKSKNTLVVRVPARGFWEGPDTILSATTELGVLETRVFTL